MSRKSDVDFIMRNFNRGSRGGFGIKDKEFSDAILSKLTLRDIVEVTIQTWEAMNGRKRDEQERGRNIQRM